MKKIRLHAKKIALLLVSVQLLEMLLPLQALALTGGPSVPEVQQFSQAGEQQLVNLFTGDFNYNIPLMDVGGYPVSISYSSAGVNMEADATCVGLGWNLDVGSISRDVRGLPDDFSGDRVVKEMNIKPKTKVGVSMAFASEFIGFDFAKFGNTFSTTMSRSNYDGWEIGLGMSQTQKFSADCGDANLSGSMDLGIGISNKGGASFDANGSLSAKVKAQSNTVGVGTGIGLAVTSREGLKSLSFGASVNGAHKHSGQPGSNTDRDISWGRTENFKFPVSFSSPAYRPTYDMPLKTMAGEFSFKVGGEVTLLHLSGSISGSASVQSLVANKDSMPAYGYIYSQNSSSGRNLLDFNRENDGAFIAERPNLPVASFTYDVYTVNGQGVGGSFRPFRSDVGTLHDPLKTQDNNAVNGGFEIGLGQLVKFGGDFKVTAMRGQTKKWEEGNSFAAPFAFKGDTDGLYEPVYFKNMGEATAMANPFQFLAMGGYQPICAEVNNNGTTTGKIISPALSEAQPLHTDYVLRKNREPRNTLFSYLTAREASANAIEKQISSYKQGIPAMQADAASSPGATIGLRRMNRTSQYRADHHLSEVTVVRNDGVRYVYGLPAYNLYTRDVSFNISRDDVHPDGKKMIEYVPGQDNTIRNRRGFDNFFESEKVPAHPYAWMLTGVLSDDYVDLTGNGPTSDDLGNYTRINYTETNANYLWRMPMQKNKAFFQEGTKSDAYDNKAHYSYGEKEIWNVHSIETKNYEAEFYYSLREDALAAMDENGGNNSRSRLSKLDSIVLYSKSERLEKGNNAVPLKKVFLEYDYTLCVGIPNGVNEATGKLTLTKISFSYGSSLKGKLSPYKFTYSATNPNYNPKKIDKWGNYIDKSAEEDDASTYAKLSKTTADTYASAWLLTGIKTPEGSSIEITYETDDYAYVQDKVAMEMFPIKALTLAGAKDAIPTDADLAAGRLYEGDTKYQYLKFELKKPTANPEELRAYISGIEELFFSAQIDLAAPSYPTGSHINAVEKVDGFVPVSLSGYNTNYGFCTGGAVGEYRYAWIKLPLLAEGDGNAVDSVNGVQPFAKAAWQKIRKNMPELIYNDPSPMDEEIDPLQFADACVNTMAAMGEFFSAPNKFMRDHGHARIIDLSKSKIRLNTPQLTKYGGGSRVKEIAIKDSWDVMTGLPNTGSTYGTEYSYTTTANIGGQQMQVSSGVASYEPSTNADENPFSVPTRYSVEKPLSIDLSLYEVGPVGQIFFPGAVIGYSKVKVRNRHNDNVTKNATGFTTHEFYTEKDFPTITRQTSLQVNPKEVPFPPFYYEKQVTVSQGVCVQLNNMHGKEKAVNVFQESDSLNPISGQQFFYKSFGKQLRDSAMVVDANTGTVTNENFGVDYEMYTDARESVEETFGPGVEVNTDGFMASVIPIYIPGIYPQMNYVLKRYRALTFTKLIHQSGILDRVESYSNGANVSTSTTVYDKQTGAPVVNEVVNEFGGKQYGVNIPAYWVANNKGMDAAYKNQGAKLEVTFPFPHDYRRLLNVGDEILIHSYSPMIGVGGGWPGLTSDAPPKKAWVLEVTEDRLSLIDEAGIRVANSGRYWIEVLRSGKRNHLTESAGSVQTLSNPVSSSGTLRIPEDRIINATASTYANIWQTYAAFTATQPQYQCNCRAYSDKLGKSYKTVLENFVRAIFSKGDYNETGVSLNTTDYNEFSAYLDNNLSRGTRKMNALRCGTQMEWQIINSDSTSCSVVLSMADGRTLFPDSILSFTLDLSLSDSSDRATCDNANTALGTITYPGGFNTSTSHLPTSSTTTARVRITSTCLPILLCEERYVGEGEINCSTTGSGKVNPFVCGILGNWRKKADYAYRSERNTGNTATGGTFTGSFNSFFTPYYPLQNSGSIPNWQLATNATVYDPYGRNLESKNSLGIYSSEVFGYGFSMPVLAAANSRYLNTAFDGFEDYQYKNAASNPWNHCPILPHFKFDTSSAKINSEFSHTGNSSLLVNTSTSLTRSYYAYEDAIAAPIEEGKFTANRNFLIQPFTPTPGKYVFSAWIRKESSTTIFGTSSGGGGGTNVLQNIGNLLGNSIPLLPSGIFTTTDLTGEVKIKCTNNSGAETVLTAASHEGKSIDGWKQINATFDIPTNVRSITVELSPGSRAWYDDVRIQPFSSMMKTFVYDPRTLRLMATLDENNYAAMYEYDNEGDLVRTKKETEDNIVTLQEIRSSKPKTR